MLLLTDCSGGFNKETYRLFVATQLATLDYELKQTEASPSAKMPRFVLNR